MLDLEILKRKGREAGEDGIVEVTAEAWAQILLELEAGRRAMARTGELFGLGRGQTL